MITNEELLEALKQLSESIDSISETIKEMKNSKSENDLDALIEDNLKLAFTYFDKVSEDNSKTDNGNTARITGLVENLTSDAEYDIRRSFPVPPPDIFPPYGRPSEIRVHSVTLPIRRKLSAYD